MSTRAAVLSQLNWLFGIVFLVIGVLNALLVHPVPGVLYLLLALGYFPVADSMSKKLFGFVIPRGVKIFLGFIVVWGTLAVGDLAEILGL